MSKFTEKIIEMLMSTQRKNYMLFCVFQVTIGQVLNFFYKFEGFIFHQLSLTMITTIGFIMINSYLNRINIFLGNRREHISLNPIKGKYALLLNHQAIGWFILLITIIFSVGVISLEYVCLDHPTAVYGLLLMCLSIITSITLYSQYVILILMLYEIGQTKYDDGEYINYNPAHTGWLVELANIAKNLTNVFLLLGFMYTLHYGLMIPSSFISINNGALAINTPNNIVFVISWFAILSFIVLGFPFLSFMLKRGFSLIVANMKNQCLSKLDTLVFMSVNSANSQLGDIEKLNKYKEFSEYCAKLMSEVLKTENSPLYGYDAITRISLVVTLLIHISTLFINVSSIIENFI